MVAFRKAIYSKVLGKCYIKLVTIIIRKSNQYKYEKIKRVTNDNLCVYSKS